MVRGRVLVIQMLAALAMLAFTGAPDVASAAMHLGPVLTFEQFRRSNPENAEVSRWGGGLRLTADIVLSTVAIEVEGLYTPEDTSFASGNSFKEADYRGRTGLLVRFLNAGPLHLAARGGLQYDLINQEYFVRASNTTQTEDLKFLTPYGGGEISLLPLSGFGILAGVTLYNDKSIQKWVPQFHVGLVFR